MREVPVFKTWLGCPLFVVSGIASLEDHPIDAGTSTEHLSASVVNASATHEFFGFRLVFPIIKTITNWIGEGSWHMYEHIPFPVHSPCFDYENPV